jgi:hypothetical protein
VTAMATATGTAMAMVTGAAIAIAMRTPITTPGAPLRISLAAGATAPGRADGATRRRGTASYGADHFCLDADEGQLLRFSNWAPSASERLVREAGGGLIETGAVRPSCGDPR